MPTDRQLSRSVLDQLVENHLSKFAHKPPVRVLDSEVDLSGARAADAEPTSGCVYNGTIYLFRDAIADTAGAVTTLWHELLHYGLRRFMVRGQYIATMKDLYRRDTLVREVCDEWVGSAEGKEVLAKHGAAYAQARGVDEALAHLASKNKGEYTNTSPVAKARRAVLAWLAALSERLGYHDWAGKLRSVGHDDARALIQSIFGQLRNDSPPVNNAPGFTADLAFSKEGQEKKASMVGGSESSSNLTTTEPSPKLIALAKKLYGGEDGARRFLEAAREFFEHVRSYTPERNHFTIDRSAIQTAKFASDDASKRFESPEHAGLDVFPWPALENAENRLGALGGYTTRPVETEKSLFVDFFTSEEQARAKVESARTGKGMAEILENRGPVLKIKIAFDGNLSVHGLKYDSPLYKKLKKKGLADVVRGKGGEVTRYPDGPRRRSCRYAITRKKPPPSSTTTKPASLPKWRAYSRFPCHWVEIFPRNLGISLWIGSESRG